MLKSKPGIYLGTTLAASAFLIYLFVVDAWGLRLALTEGLFGPPTPERPSFAVPATFFVLMLGWLIVAVPVVWTAFAVVERALPKRYTFAKPLTHSVFMTAAALFGIMAGVHQLIMLSQEGSVYLLHAFASMIAVGYSLILLFDAYAFMGFQRQGGVLRIKGLTSARRIPLNALESIREERGRLYIRAGEDKIYLPFQELIEIREDQRLTDWFGPLVDPRRRDPLARWFLALLQELDQLRARPLDETEEAARRFARAPRPEHEPPPEIAEAPEEEEAEEEPPVLGAPIEPKRPKHKEKPKAQPAGGAIALGAPDEKK